MSRKHIQKSVMGVVCDYCEEEINQEDAKNWAHITRQYVSKPTTFADRLLFWLDSNTKAAVTMDFHARCLLSIIEKAIKAKHGSSSLPGEEPK